MFAQRDSKLNIQMSEDSKQVALLSVILADAAKRDSSSMKFIAVLTTFFLPGTCVAVGTSHFLILTKANFHRQYLRCP
jgi:hypothetical protein